MSRAYLYLQWCELKCTISLISVLLIITKVRIGKVLQRNAELVLLCFHVTWTVCSFPFATPQTMSKGKELQILDVRKLLQIKKKIALDKCFESPASMEFTAVYSILFFVFSSSVVSCVYVFVSISVNLGARETDCFCFRLHGTIISNQTSGALTVFHFNIKVREFWTLQLHWSRLFRWFSESNIVRLWHLETLDPAQCKSQFIVAAAGWSAA